VAQQLDEGPKALEGKVKGKVELTENDFFVCLFEKKNLSVLTPHHPLSTVIRSYLPLLIQTSQAHEDLYFHP